MDVFLNIIVIIMLVAVIIWASVRISVIKNKQLEQERHIQFLNDQFENLWRQLHLMGAAGDHRSELQSSAKEVNQPETQAEAQPVPAAAHSPEPQHGPASTQATEELELISQLQSQQDSDLQSVPAKRTLPPEEQKHKINVTESWVGRNVLGIAASVLIFIGLIFLGALIYRHLSNDVKIAGMFLISAIPTGLGFFLSRKKPNPFTVILTGCGFGAFYLSILLTHLYFGRLSQMVALIVLLVWTVVTLLAAKKLASAAISVVAHIGMAIALCFAFSQPLLEKNLFSLVVYQLVSIVVLVGGSLLCCKKTYRFGLIISFGLTLAASGFMLYRMLPELLLSPQTLIIVAFIAQFLCASFLSYLLTTSECRIKDDSIRLLVHVLNKVMWLVALLLNIYWVTHRLVYGSYLNSGLESLRSAPILAAVLITVVVLVIQSGFSIIMGLRSKLERRLETVSVLMASGLAMALMLILYGYQIAFGAAPWRQLTFLIVLALLLLFARRVSGNKLYFIAAFILFWGDVISMLVRGYSQLNQYGTIAFSVGYLLIYLLLICSLWLSWNKERREAFLIRTRLSAYLLVETAIIAILLTSNLNHRVAILLICLTVLNAILSGLRFEGRGSEAKLLYGVLRSSEFACVFAVACFIAFASKNAPPLLSMILFISAIILALMRLKANLLEGSINLREEGLYLLKLLVLVEGGVCGLAAGSPLRVVWMLNTLVALGIVFYILRYQLYRFHKRLITGSDLDLGLRIIENVVVFMVMIFLAFYPHYYYEVQLGDPTPLFWLLVVLSFGLAFVRLRELIKGMLLPVEEASLGLKLTGLVLATAHGIAGLTGAGFEVSLLSMFTALVCVLMGFGFKAKTLRLYGVVLVLLCVLKLVTFDVIGLNTGWRVAAFIGGGIICFVISAIYSYSVKKIDRVISEKGSEKDTDRSR
ncbi:MAG: DUF2339 domain-containing protein [Coriobacteriia bacterium]|nr:DUF2339 domain-containing protein [Coriobacteriia bacterium]